MDKNTDHILNIYDTDIIIITNLNIVIQLRCYSKKKKTQNIYKY